jgi:acyl-CoA thioesterase-1
MNRIIAVALVPVILAACGDARGSRAAESAQQTAPLELRRSIPAPPDARPVVLFVGTSLTAGLGVGAALAFPALIQGKIDSAGLSYRVVNAGISGETSAGGLSRIEWVLQQPVQILVLELGANDGLRGLDPDSMKSNLDRIIEKTRSRYPKSQIVIAGMQAPPNLGARYTHRFRAAFGELADKHDAVFIPFLLAGVAGIPSLNQDDGIHPTAEGQRIIADTVWNYLRPLLRQPR